MIVIWFLMKSIAAAALDKKYYVSKRATEIWMFECINWSVLCWSSRHLYEYSIRLPSC